MTSRSWRSSRTLGRRDQTAPDPTSGRLSDQPGDDRLAQSRTPADVDGHSPQVEHELPHYRDSRTWLRDEEAKAVNVQQDPVQRT
jgi:hypothetical protein